MTVTSQIQTKRRKTTPAPQGRDEMNLVEFPFATLSRRPSMGSITCQRWIGDGQGKRHRQRWTVQGGSASGLPTEFDERVYVALLAITREQGNDERKVGFSVYQLLRIMGETTDSKHYRSVERSLERLLRVSIVAEGAFWDAESKSLQNMMNGFHLVERYWLAYKEGDEKTKKSEGVRAYIVWGEEIWRSFTSGYLKRLDLRFFFSLETPVARRLYRFLDKKMHKKGRLEIDIFQLSQQLGMAYYRYPAKVKEKLQPGIDELIAKGFLAHAESIKVKGYTRMRFEKSGREAKTLPTSPTKVEIPKQAKENCGQYGCSADDWRRQMVKEHKISEEHVGLWDQVLKLARKELSLVNYQVWLARTQLLDLEADRATVLVPNGFFRTAIEPKCGRLLKKCIDRLLHSKCTLVYRQAE